MFIFIYCWQGRPAREVSATPWTCAPTKWRPCPPSWPTSAHASTSRSAAARYELFEEWNESRRCSGGYFVYFPSFFPMRRCAFRRRQGSSTTVLRIHEIWVSIRIRGSIPLANGSETCYFRQWLSRRQQIFFFLNLFCLLLFEGQLTSFFIDKKS